MGSVKAVSLPVLLWGIWMRVPVAILAAVVIPDLLLWFCVAVDILTTMPVPKVWFMDAVGNSGVMSIPVLLRCWIAVANITIMSIPIAVAVYDVIFVPILWLGVFSACLSAVVVPVLLLCHGTFTISTSAV